MQAWVDRGDRREDIDSVASRWRMASVRPLCLGLIVQSEGVKAVRGRRHGAIGVC